MFESLAKVYGTTEAQATVSCDKDFYAYALLADAKGPLAVVSGDDTYYPRLKLKGKY